MGRSLAGTIPANHRIPLTYYFGLLIVYNIPTQLKLFATQDFVNTIIVAFYKYVNSLLFCIKRKKENSVIWGLKSREFLESGW